MRRCSPDEVAKNRSDACCNASRTVGDHAIEVRRQSESEFQYAVLEVHLIWLAHADARTSFF